MNNYVSHSVYFGIALSLLTYWLALKIRTRFDNPFVNPLLLSAIFTIIILSILKIDYQSYHQGAQMMTHFLTPATICLAIPMYRQSRILAKHADAIFISLICGSIAGMLSIIVICLLWDAPHMLIFSLLPKSVTTSIAIGVSELIGGNSTITVGVVIVTGILGACLSQTVFKYFRIEHPVAKGLALGNSAHAIGTAKALELGDLEGAMSSLSIVIAGVITVFLAPIVVNLLF